MRSRVSGERWEGDKRGKETKELTSSELSSLRNEVARLEDLSGFEHLLGVEVPRESFLLLLVVGVEKVVEVQGERSSAGEQSTVELLDLLLLLDFDLGEDDGRLSKLDLLMSLRQPRMEKRRKEDKVISPDLNFVRRAGRSRAKVGTNLERISGSRDVLLAPFERELVGDLLERLLDRLGEGSEFGGDGRHGEEVRLGWVVGG